LLTFVRDSLLGGTPTLAPEPWQGLKEKIGANNVHFFNLDPRRYERDGIPGMDE
jgi:hypothetical protein